MIVVNYVMGWVFVLQYGVEDRRRMMFIGGGRRGRWTVESDRTRNLP